jgi:polyisoprenoid-binding protein YceI
MSTLFSNSSVPSRRWAAIGIFAATALISVQQAFGAHLENAQGKIRFTATQSEVPVDGEFQKFAAEVDFSPAKPDVGKVDFAVDVMSVSTGSSDADDLLKGKDFFDAKQFPRATFSSTTISSSGGDQFQTRGTFTLKGHSFELVIPFTARPEKDGMRIDGRFPISRRAYGVGIGQWADTGLIADEVLVRFSLFIPR